MDRIGDARNLNEKLEKNLKQTSVSSVWSVDFWGLLRKKSLEEIFLKKLLTQEII